MTFVEIVDITQIDGLKHAELLSNNFALSGFQSQGQGQNPNQIILTELEPVTKEEFISRGRGGGQRNKNPQATNITIDIDDLIMAPYEPTITELEYSIRVITDMDSSWNVTAARGDVKALLQELQGFGLEILLEKSAFPSL